VKIAAICRFHDSLLTFDYLRKSVYRIVGEFLQFAESAFIILANLLGQVAFGHRAHHPYNVIDACAGGRQQPVQAFCHFFVKPLQAVHIDAGFEIATVGCVDCASLAFDDKR
jgi:hypothetical protein